MAKLATNKLLKKLLALLLCVLTQVYPDYFKACAMVQESEQRD